MPSNPGMAARLNKITCETRFELFSADSRRLEDEKVIGLPIRTPIW